MKQILNGREVVVNVFSHHLLHQILEPVLDHKFGPSVMKKSLGYKSPPLTVLKHIPYKLEVFLHPPFSSNYMPI